MRGLNGNVDMQRSDRPSDDLIGALKKVDANIMLL